MTTSVKTNMSICDKISIIEVTLVDENLFKVNVKTDCLGVESYVKGLGLLSMNDILDLTISKMTDSERLKAGQPTCLVPTAIFNAAWIEAGLISRKLAEKCGNISIEFNCD